MNKADRIATYYSNARELIKQNNPKLARAYVLQLLNEALEAYHASATILSKAKNAVFLERWICVSRDLYDHGITDYVLDCFGLPRERAKKAGPTLKKPAAPKPEHSPASLPDGGVDLAGLVDDAAKSQGWCAEIFAAYKTAVAEIRSSAAAKETNGTGFIISDKGYLLTNDHVVFDEDSGVYYPKVRMSLYGEKKMHKVEVLFSDRDADVALCKFDPEEVQGFTVVRRIRDYSTLLQGADCLLIGNAFGLGLAPCTGEVRFTKNEHGNLVYTVPSNPGDSGAPIFSRNGECIGINKSKTLSINGSAADAYANATPMDKIDELLEKWTKNNDIEL